MDWAKKPRKAPAKARVATFNVEWFPDGERGDAHTDLEWLACAIASLQVDALAVQEFKTTPTAQASLREVLTRLDALSGGQWRSSIAECPGNTGNWQHVGVLYDSRRVTAGGARTLAELNPHGGGPCNKQLRPGREVTLTWKSGRSAQLVSVHFKAKDDDKSYALRGPSFAALETLFDWKAANVIVAGDFNTVGCKHCAPPLTQLQERQARADALAPYGASLLPRDTGCSSYHGGQPGLLDGFVVSTSLAGAHVEPAGQCALTACVPGRAVEKSAASHQLSDHCPLVLELPF